MKRKLLWTAVFVAVLALFCTGCGNPADSNNTPVTNTDVVFSDLTADGSATATTTTLTLTFDKDITGIAAADITIDPKSTGTVKGALTRTGTGTYRLAVTGITASGQIGVTVSKAGYNISPASNNVNVFYYYDPSAIAAAFNNLTANGTENETTTLLTFTFDKDIAGLTAADITIDPKDTGTIKGDLTRTGIGVYQLAVTGIGAAGQINITVSKAGYTISPPNRTVNVFYYSDPSAIQAAFTNLEADGAEGEATTTTLTLTFNKDITDFAAADIVLNSNNTGAVKGDLTRTGTGVYQLAVNGITAAGQITVGVTKDGYNITPASRNANVFYYSDSTDIAVSFTNLEADGSAAATTTFLTLAFDEDISGLSAADITIDPKGTGTTRGYLTQNLTTGEYRLAVSGITVSGQISVTVSKAGYTITPASTTVNVFYYFDPSAIAVAFTALSANGAENETTTKLTLTFSENIEGLTENDIILTPNSTGVEKGAVSTKGGGVYELAVDNISAAGEITVSVFKDGYSITPPGIDVDVFYYAPPPPPVAVSFDNLIADGSATVTTGKLTLTFDKDIEGLTEDDITLTPNDTGTVKGVLTHTGTTGVYELTVTDITALGEISVAASKSGYSITPASRNANMFYYSAPPPPVNAAFSGLSADGSAETAITTKLTLTFDRDIAGLTASDIILMSNIGAEKGELTSKGGGVYELSVSGINAEGEITVKVEKTGYDISPPSRNVNVHYTPPAGNLIITYTEITDKAPLITGPTLYRVSHGGPTGVTLIINNPERYDSNSISWTVQDTKVEGTGPEFTLSANNAAYNFIGEHFVTVSVKIDGVPYNKTVSFKVEY